MTVPPNHSITQSFTYDALNRLKSAGEANWSQTYNYDAKASRSIVATPGVSNTWPPAFSVSPFAPLAANGATYDGANHLTVSTVTHYYAAGNQTVVGGYSSTFDAEGRLTSNTINSATTSYIYDGEGQRVAKLTCPTASPCDITTTGAVVQTIYVYDAAGNLAAEYSSISSDCTVHNMLCDCGSSRKHSRSHGYCRQCGPALRLLTVWRRDTSRRLGANHAVGISADVRRAQSKVHGPNERHRKLTGLFQCALLQSGSRKILEP